MFSARTSRRPPAVCSSGMLFDGAGRHREKPGRRARAAIYRSGRSQKSGSRRCIHRQHADALRGVDQEHCVTLPQRRAYFLDIDRTAVRPVHRGDRGQADRRCIWSLDGREHRRGPVAIIRPADRFNRETLRFGACMPFEHRRGMDRLPDHRQCAARDLENFGRGRDAVADRGSARCRQHRHGLPCRGRPRAFMLLVGERGVERPRRALAPDRTAGFQRSQRQRTVEAALR